MSHCILPPLPLLHDCSTTSPFGIFTLYHCHVVNALTRSFSYDECITTWGIGGRLPMTDSVCVFPVLVVCNCVDSVRHAGGENSCVPLVISI